MMKKRGKKVFRNKSATLGSHHERARGVQSKFSDSSDEGEFD